MALLSVASKSILLYLLRLLVVHAIRKGRVNNILHSITQHNSSDSSNSSSSLLGGLNRLVLDTPALTSEKDSVKQLAAGALHKIGLSVVDSSSSEGRAQIFPKQEDMLKHHQQCKKCGYKQLHRGEVRESGGLLSQIFNIQNRKFITMSCDRCSFSEYYETSQNGLSDYLTMALK